MLGQPSFISDIAHVIEEHGDAVAEAAERENWAYAAAVSRMDAAARVEFDIF